MDPFQVGDFVCLIGSDDKTVYKVLGINVCLYKSDNHARIKRATWEYTPTFIVKTKRLTLAEPEDLL